MEVRKTTNREVERQKGRKMLIPYDMNKQQTANNLPKKS